MFNITNTTITIMVNDMSKSIVFYTDGLGFKLLNQYGNHYAQISAPGITIGLHPSKTKTNLSENISVGFTVNDFEEAKNQLHQLTIEHNERKEQGGNFIHFKDPDGTPLYFIEPQK